jgi:putative anti-sigma factor antagonist btrV
MEISQEKVNDIAVVSLKGRLNVTTTAELEQVFTKLLEEKQTKVLVECRELEYISSAGLRVLLTAAKQFKKISGEIALAGLSQNVKQVFEISGFTSIFPIYTTQDEAVKAM